MKSYLNNFTVTAMSVMLGATSVSAYEDALANTIHIYLDNIPYELNTHENTVGSLLSSLRPTLFENFIIEKDLSEDAIIEHGMEIFISSVTEESLSYIKTIPFETITEETDDLLEGETFVLQIGETGVKEIIEKETYHAHELMFVDFVEENIIVEPITEIIQIGTGKPAPIIEPVKPEEIYTPEPIPKTIILEPTPTPIQEPSLPMINGYTYTSAIQAKVTAYTPYDAGCNGITATGSIAKRGVVAVDPSVIPLGSTVYIPGYGIAVAEDVGGAIKGNRVDICVDTTAEAFAWGVQNVTVYVLSK